MLTRSLELVFCFFSFPLLFSCQCQAIGSEEVHSNQADETFPPFPFFPVVLLLLLLPLFQSPSVLFIADLERQCWQASWLAHSLSHFYPSAVKSASLFLLFLSSFLSCYHLLFHLDCPVHVLVAERKMDCQRAI